MKVLPPPSCLPKMLSPDGYNTPQSSPLVGWEVNTPPQSYHPTPPPLLSFVKKIEHQLF